MFTIGQLAEVSEKSLIRQFGEVGSLIKRQSLGIDFRSVKAAYPPDIIMTERMFESVMTEPAQLQAYLNDMALLVSMRLRKMGALAGETTLTILDESDSRTSVPISAFFRYKKPTDSTCTIVQSLTKLLEAKMQPGMEISKLTVILSDITRGRSSQLSLMGENERKNRLDRTIELIRSRFGNTSVYTAGTLNKVSVL